MMGGGWGGGQHHNGSSTENHARPSSSRPPSNEKLLCTAFISFQCFAVAQTIAAFIAGSEAMMGDSAAMMVDALTYLFNWFAERQKGLYASKFNQRRHSTIYSLEYQKYTYQLELVPPLLSVSTLLIVTGFVLNKSIRILVLDSKRDVSEQGDPNVKLMIIFSVLNLLLDVVNVGCFALAKHALGYKTTTDVAVESHQGDGDIDSDRRFLCDADDRYDDEEETLSLSFDNFTGEGRIRDIESEPDDDHLSTETETIPMKPFEMEGPNGDCRGANTHRGGYDDEANLNMCSAYTHVFADTLRSLAVILASLLAEFVPSITSEEADAAAAVVVSILIVLSLVPLLGGMVHTYNSLLFVNQQLQEERNRLFLEGEEIQFQDEEDDNGDILLGERAGATFDLTSVR